MKDLPSKKEIVASSISTDSVEPLDGTYVYFLVCDESIIYVGQTSNLHSRIMSHKQCKKFDKVHFIKCSDDNVSEVEAKYIYEIENRLNKRMPDNSMFMSAGAMDLNAKNMVWPIARKILRDITEPYVVTINGNRHRYIRRGDEEKIMASYAAIVRNLIQEKVEKKKADGFKIGGTSNE